MSRYAAVDLSQYPVSDVLASLGYEGYLARDQADLQARWAAVQAANPSLNLPGLDLSLETEPLTYLLQTGSYRETLLRAAINDQVRQLLLSGATGAALDQIGVTYYRTLRKTITAATSTTAAVLEDDDTFRERLSLVPESWSVAGPEGAYVSYALGASGDVLDCAAYSQDDGVGLAPQVSVVILSASSPDGTAPASLIASVQQALSAKSVRPLGDLVTVQSATPATFNAAINLGILAGASASTVVAAATAKVGSYLTGRTRWIGGATTGPVYVIGRRYREITIAGACVQPGVEEVSVSLTSATPGLVDPTTGDVNVPVAGSPANLFLAPRLGTLTVTTSVISGNY